MFVSCTWGRRSTKGGVSGPAEDLRPVSEVEAGVNVRPAGGVREQVGDSISRRQPGTGTRQVREGAVIPFTWTWVGHQAKKGLWVRKGNARTRMLPANLDHLRVEWRK